MMVESVAHDFSPGVYLGGQITKQMTLKLKPYCELLFFKLHHGSINMITRENLSYVNNTAVALDSLNAPLACELAPLFDNEDMFNVARSFDKRLSQYGSSQPNFAAFVCHALTKNLDYNDIKQSLLQQTSMSPRGFEVKFKRQVGINPKKYANLNRLRQVTELFQYSSDTDNLTQVAYDLGFYDQAHFTRAFSTFAGASPSKVDFSTLFVPDSNEMMRFFTI